MRAYPYERAAGGRRYGKNTKACAPFTAPGYSFLRAAIGWQRADAQ
jgi:prolyl oligopeptidase